MSRQVLFIAVTLCLVVCLPLTDGWSRGFGGGARGFGGGARGFGGGGFGGGGLGGAGRSFGGVGGSMRGNPGSPFGGVGRNIGGRFGGESGRTVPGGSDLGGLKGAGRDLGGLLNGGGGGRNELRDRDLGGLGGADRGQGGLLRGGGVGGSELRDRDLGGLGGGGRNTGSGAFRDSFGDRFSGDPPRRSQLNNFLGLPSDAGMHHLSSNTSRDFADDFDVKHGSVEGPRGGVARGSSITGPRDNTFYRGAAKGPRGGVAAGRGVVGSGGAAAGQGFAAGPRGRTAAGGFARGPNGGIAARGAVAGPRGMAAGFARVLPSGRYKAGVAVRGNFRHWDYYGARWYTNHPDAWRAAAWGVGAAWRAATWRSVVAWMDYYPAAPVYYDYGNTVTYQDNNVYVNGQDAGSSEQYYDQASSLASTGAQADASPDGDWLPLGVFALSQSDKTRSVVTLQPAVNKQGVIRGNSTDSVSGQTKVIRGSVDKKTQRVAFTVGDDSTEVVETGLYNLTKDEAPVLIHFGTDRTEQWLLVRLKQPDSEDEVDGDQAAD